MSLRFRSVMMIALVIAGGAAVYFAATRKYRTYSSEAKFLLINRCHPSEKTLPLIEDIADNQRSFIKSTIIAERVAHESKIRHILENRGFSAFPGVKTPDNLVPHIINGLSVAREKGDDDNPSRKVLRATFSCSDQAECQIILATVLDAYQIYLDECQFDLAKSWIDTLDRRRLNIEKKVAVAESHLNDFLKSAPQEMGFQLARTKLNQLVQKSTEAATQLIDMDARLKYWSNAAAKEETLEGVKLKANEWAIKTGQDKNQATVAQYLASLRSRRDELENLNVELSERIKVVRRELHDLIPLENEELRLRENVAHARGEHADAVREVERQKQLLESTMYRVITISRPSVGR